METYLRLFKFLGTVQNGLGIVWLEVKLNALINGEKNLIIVIASFFVLNTSEINLVGVANYLIIVRVC